MTRTPCKTCGRPFWSKSADYCSRLCERADTTYSDGTPKPARVGEIKVAARTPGQRGV